MQPSSSYIAILVLTQNKIDVVKYSLLGSILSNLLLAVCDSSSSTDCSASTSSFASDLPLLAADLNASCDDSARPSFSAAAADLLTKKLLTSTTNKSPKSTSNRYFSLSRFSSVFKKDSKSATPPPLDPNRSGSALVRKPSSWVKEVIRKYLKKVKPRYEKLSQRQQQQQPTTNSTSFCSKPLSTLNWCDLDCEIGFSSWMELVCFG